MGQILFEGQGTFVLPCSQSAKAVASGGAVEITFRLLREANQLVTVAVLLRPNDATELSAQLLTAAGQVEKS